MVADRFDHVLVDEYQDTNRLQADDPAALKPDGRGVTVVGDDAQSIYAFRAADGAQHPRVPGAVHARRPRIVTLEQNYRSTQPILDASNAVIGLGCRALHKNLRSDRQSAPKPALVTSATTSAQVRCVVEHDARDSRGRRRAQGAGGAVPRLRTTAPCSRSSWPGATFRSSSSAG